MSYDTWQAIANTPWWLYLCLFFLLMIGYQAKNPRFIRVRMQYFLQGSLLALMMGGYIYYIQPSLVNSMLSIMTMTCGIVIGYCQFKLSGIKACDDNHTLFIPGSYLPFCIILMLIIAKYYYFGPGFNIDINSSMMSDYQHHLSLFAGLYLGLMIGRYWWVKNCLKHGPYMDVDDKVITRKINSA